jgi:hypothetical protein
VGGAVGEQLAFGDGEIEFRAVGELQARNARALEAPAAQAREQATKQAAWRTATLLPRRYREGLPQELRFPMVNAIAEMLRAGVGVPAIVRYAELAELDGRYALDKHVPLLRSAMRMLRGDINTGQVCRQCGTEPRDAFGPPCARCRPGALREDLTPGDLAELEAARRFLGDDDGDGDERHGDERQVDHDGAPPMVPLDGMDGPSAPPDGPQRAPDGPTGTMTHLPATGEATDDLSDASDSSDTRGASADRPGRRLEDAT